MKITLLTGKTFSIEERVGFPIIVNRSGRSKKLSLRIDTQKRLPILNVPRFCSDRKAVKFAVENKEWVDAHLARLPVSKKFDADEAIVFFGEKLTIKHEASLRGGVFIEDGFIFVSGCPEFVSRRVKDFIKKEAGKKLLELSREKAKKIGAKVERVVIKDTKSRWGSCSTLNNINYNWRIALAPREVIDYLVAHEVAHLAHRNHSNAFWNCVAELSEHAGRGRNWLKNHSHELLLYE